MTFTEDYGKVLSPFLKKYQVEENEKRRRAVLKNTAEAVVKSKDLLEEKTDDLPKDIQTVPLSFFSFFPLFHNFSLLQAIMRYFKGCIKMKSATESGDPKPVKIKQVYSIMDAIKQNYQDLVQKEMKFPTIQAISTTSAVTSRQ